MQLVAIDPGNNSGWAVYENGILKRCGLAKAIEDFCGLLVAWPPSDTLVERAVIEHPKIYPNGRTADPNAIVKLAVNAGEWGGLFRSFNAKIDYVFPRDWKGTIDPDICNARVWSALNDNERNIVDQQCKGVAPSKRHNVLDAIGIGLFAIGRFRL